MCISPEWLPGNSLVTRKNQWMPGTPQWRCCGNSYPEGAANPHSENMVASPAPPCGMNILLGGAARFQEPATIHRSIHPSISLSISLQDPPNRGGRRHQGVSPFYYIYHPKLIFPIISCMRKCPVQGWDRIPQFSWYFYTPFQAGQKTRVRNETSKTNWHEMTRHDRMCSEITRSSSGIHLGN